MRLHLEAYFNLSKDLPAESEEEIQKIFDTFAEKIIKQHEQGHFEFPFLKIKDDKLFFAIDTEETIYPHVAILRLRKELAKTIGPTYRIGLRGFKIEKYVIERELEYLPMKEFTLPFTKKIDFISSKKGEERKAVIEIDPEIPEDFVEKGAIQRIVNLVEDKISKQHHGAKKEHHKTLWYSGEINHPNQDNPTRLLEEKEWIVRTNYRNQWVFTPSITVLVEAFKQIMVDYLYKPLNYHQMMIPKLVDWSIWLRSGHAEAMFQGGFEPYFVVQPREATPEYFEEIADYVTIAKQIPEQKLYEKVNPPMGGLSFAQCPPLWVWLQGKTIAKDSLPIKIFDWSGPTYRYESGSAYGFERVDELHRIETLFIGTPEQATTAGVETRKKLREVFNDVLELEFREAKVVPWWLQQTSKEEEEEEATEEEGFVGTVDYEAYMPYKGSREESEWLEIQNVSIIGEKYPKGFSVKTDGGAELWSGCGGGSFERFITAFIAQKGMNKKNWPDKFLAYVDEIPDTPVFR